MASDTIPHVGGEADRLREAIRLHRRQIRPSCRRPEDDELYQALTGAKAPATLNREPPDSYLDQVARYYDSPF